MNNFDDLLNNNPDTPTAENEQGGQQLSKEEYAEKKKAEREEVYALSDKAATDVVADGNTFQKYLDLQGRLERYSAVNTLLVFARNPDASRLGNFDYWKKNNCSVKGGQTAIMILEPQEYTKEDGSPGISYNVKKVFDISQVDARKFRMPPTPKYSERQILSALVSNAPMKIIGVDELPNNLCAMTDPQTGDISVRRGMEFSRTFSALTQCIAAAELAEKPESQIEDGFSDCSVSYIICKKYGIDTQIFRFDDTPNVFEGMEAQDIKGELSKIRDVAESISGRMTKQLEAQQKAAKNNEAR